MPAALLSDAIEVGIVTAHMDKMRHFYGEVLDLDYEGELPFPGGTMHRYKLGGAIVKLVAYDTMPEAALPGGGEAGLGIRYFSFGVADLDTAVADWKAGGAQMAMEITPFGGGIGFCFLADPDGNWIEVFGVTQLQ